MAANGGLHEPFPDQKTSPPYMLRHKGFKIETQKLPILKAGPIEEMTNSLGIAPPEMIFGDNYILIEHEASGWFIKFNAYDALDRVDKTGETMLQVAHSGEWKRSREHYHEDIKEIVKPFDWSYTTDYKGTTPKDPQFQATETPIPLHLLRRPDPIRYFDEIMLYEDELADNGMSMLSCKIRVMPDRLLLLVRLFMRLDGVMCRVRDTRIYVEFETSEIIREYTAREDSYETVRQSLAMTREDIPASLRDSNKLSELLPVVEKSLERVILS